MTVQRDGVLTVPLYHGTSTVFLDGIAAHGLGGRDPVRDWHLLDLAREVWHLAQVHLQDTQVYRCRQASFANMTEQHTGHWNWQHGDTYLSPARSTAIRYATNKRFGSELLTYTLEFLDELIRADVPGVRSDLFGRFPDVFNLLNVSVAPVLVEARNVPIGALGTEGGRDDIETLMERLESVARGELSDVVLQQSNFRLRQRVELENLRVSLICVLQWNALSPRIRLYEIDVAQGAREAALGGQEPN